MRILQVSPSYAPVWEDGGPPRVLYDYARGLVGAGHELEVLTPRGGWAPGEAPEPGLASVAFHSYDTFGGPLARIYCDSSPAQLRTWARAHLPRFDVMHVAQSRTLANAVITREARRLGIPYVFSAFGSLPRRGNALKLLWDVPAVNPMVRGAACCLAQTDHEAAVYREFGAPESRIALFPLGFDEAALTVPDTRGAFRAAFGIGAEETVVLFLGRLHRTKGVDLLIDIFSASAARDRQLRLVVVGSDNGAEAELRQRAAASPHRDRITFVGPQYGEARIPAYADADVYAITPRVFEETPLAAIEAMACGTPVITNVRAGIPYLTGECGVILQDDSVERGAEAMLQRAHAAREGGPALRTRVREHARATFGLRRITRDLDAILQWAARVERSAVPLAIATVRERPSR